MDLSNVLGGVWLGQPAWMWLVFVGTVAALLAFDLGVLGRRRGGNGEIGVRRSLLLSLFYIAAAEAFGGWVWLTLGAQSGLEYFTGFALEKALALDNVFVISMIFGALAIPRQYQHRVLFWGILGVLVLRAAMIGLGAALVTQFEWVMWVFAAFLIYSGVRMLLNRDAEEQAPDPARHPLIRALGRLLPITPQLHGDRFMVRLPDAAGRLRRHATPLLVALITVEAADLVFAVDSIPAIFAITKDPFLVYTSNIFAVLGLRALYFALEALLHRFEALKTALSLVLVFIGGKIVYAQFFGKVDAGVSLGVTLALLLGGVLYGLWQTRGRRQPLA
ncbi:TerC family protein [Deinococcus sp. Marseille-Q6407]|uniref:TerC family protein n=1 Tax=Deinococcus sp. Marseille-Q6407 TaxID=2969223 RepID=UPI0021BF7DA9|nr:TerC family protein [Deinococcus sp. Marseille-Q6407]